MPFNSGLDRTIQRWQRVTADYLRVLPKRSPKRRRATRLGCTIDAPTKAAAETLALRLRQHGTDVMIVRLKDKRGWFLLTLETRYRALTLPSVNDWIRHMASTASKHRATFRGWAFYNKYAAA